MNALDTDLSTLESAMRLFSQTMKRPQTWLRVTRRAGINLDRPAVAILHNLAQAPTGTCRVHDLALQLGIEAPSVTRKTQQLELAGYLRRTPDRRDRRAIDLRITPRGRTIASRLWQAQCEMISEALHYWPASERRQFVELFQRFSQDLANTSASEATNKVRSVARG